MIIDGGGSIGETFGYDANGNRTSYSGPTGSITSANTLYDDQDRLKTYGNATFTYGANGEIRTKTVGGAITTYTYDALGNLVKVQRPGGLPDIEYGVDGLGRRISKKVGGTVTRRWLYRDKLSPVAELDGTGTLVARFVYGSRKNVPDLVLRGATTYRVIVDQLGSPRVVVDTATLGTCTANIACASVPYRADYSAFGEVTWRGDGPSNLGWLPFGFAGGLYDPDTGLLRFGARDYDPQIGRWVSKDPILFNGRQTNVYVYANSDPVNSRDPSGLVVRHCWTRANASGLAEGGFNHHWIETRSASFGLAGSIDDTQVMSHDGWYSDERHSVVCQSLPEIDEDCVDRYFATHNEDHMGNWWYPGNTCISFVDDVFDACGTAPGRMSPMEGTEGAGSF